MWPELTQAARIAAEHLGRQLEPYAPPPAGCPPLLGWAAARGHIHMIKVAHITPEDAPLLGWLPIPMVPKTEAYPVGTQCIPGWRPRVTAVLSHEGAPSDGLFPLETCDWNSLMVTTLASVGLTGHSSRDEYRETIRLWAEHGPASADALWTVTALATSFRCHTLAVFQHPGGWFLDYLYTILSVRAERRGPCKYVAVANGTYACYPGLLELVRAQSGFDARATTRTASSNLQETCGNILEVYGAFLMAIGAWPAAFGLIATCIQIEVVMPP